MPFSSPHVICLFYWNLTDYKKHIGEESQCCAMHQEYVSRTPAFFFCQYKLFSEKSAVLILYTQQNRVQSLSIAKIYVEMLFLFNFVLFQQLPNFIP